MACVALVAGGCLFLLVLVAAGKGSPQLLVLLSDNIYAGNVGQS